jgi:hypothetical protein
MKDDYREINFLIWLFIFSFITILVTGIYIEHITWAAAKGN